MEGKVEIQYYKKEVAIREALEYATDGQVWCVIELPYGFDLVKLNNLRRGDSVVFKTQANEVRNEKNWSMLRKVRKMAAKLEGGTNGR